MRKFAIFGWIVMAFGCGHQNNASPTIPGQNPLRVITYNVNFGIAGDPQTIDALRQTNADVAVLQETNEAWELSLRNELRDLYPHMLFRHSGGAGGLAVLSKFPFEDREFLPSETEWFPAWHLVVQSPMGPIRVLAVHLRPPVSDSGSVVSGYFSTKSVREEEITGFYERLSIPEGENLPTIVVGDFNERRGRAIRYLEDRGFRSALPQFQSSQRTWHWQTRIGEVSSQLDHVMYNDPLVAVHSEVSESGNSDHFPVIVDFVVNGANVNGE